MKRMNLLLICIVILACSCSGEQDTVAHTTEPPRRQNERIETEKSEIPNSMPERTKKRQAKPVSTNEKEPEIKKDIPRDTDKLSGEKLDPISGVGGYGIGGLLASVHGQRWGRGALLAREGGSPGTESAILAALRWLRSHQDKDGKWDQDGFESCCKDGKCGGKGTGQFDVAVTGLALLAYMGSGNTNRVGKFKKTVRRGLDWLRKQQQADGSLGSERKVESWVYNHAIGTLALCEAYAVSRDYRFKDAAQKAVDYILKAQNPALGWRYKPKSGRSDSSVTGWMVLALKAAKDAKLKVEQSAFDGAINWFDKATDARGKCGYMYPGDPGSVIKDINMHYAMQPTMTGVSVFCRLLCGQARLEAKIPHGVDILMANLPEWDKPKFTRVDPYYWFWATNAVFQYGGKNWDKWNKALKMALLENQRAGGCANGSWDPDGKWGMVGGRVCTTALAALTLEVYYRYRRVKDKKSGK